MLLAGHPVGPVFEYDPFHGEPGPIKQKRLSAVSCAPSRICSEPPSLRSRDNAQQDDLFREFNENLTNPQVTLSGGRIHIDQ